jgi:hypothetical protein
MGSREGRESQACGFVELNSNEEISMKKTLITCVAIAALFVVASSASAIVCTIDQRPAATLLVPYFQVAVNADGSLMSGPAALNTLVTITNASSAPMIAHVNVYNEKSVLVLDFNIALTGFDVQSMSMGDVITGTLPQTPVSSDGHHTLPGTAIASDPCQRNAAAKSGPQNFLRINPSLGGVAATPLDNTLATTLYNFPQAWQPGSVFAAEVLGGLTAKDATACNPSGITTFPLASPGLARGYILIDHANYCNLSDPTSPTYWNNDAAGNENNLIGEIIFTSGSGVPTFGVSTVNIESSRVFSSVANGGYFDQTDTTRERTFYARYWIPSGITRPNANTPLFAAKADLWDQGFGDEREPLGLKYAARYFQTTLPGVASFLRVWRASAGSLTDLTGSKCTAQEPSVNITFFDEDELPFQPTGQPPCPSPCTTPPPNVFNFPLETQRVPITTFSQFLPPAFAGSQVGWLAVSFVNVQTTLLNDNGLLDQAWIDYEFAGSGAFINASIPGTQLDPSTCHPLLIPLSSGNFNIAVPDALTDPVTPGSHTGLLANPATGTGP